MSLTFKKSTPKDYSNIKVLFDDTTPSSPKFFRVSDVPQVLTKGKNLIRISAHPSNLVPNSQIIVDIKDANGTPIYFEIPDYLEDDKSRVISIWVYHDKGDDNTANGDATITIYGVARTDQNGKPVPTSYRGKHNVKWSTSINVDRNRETISPVIFKSDNLPIVSISESIETYQNLPTNNTELQLTTQSGTNARYFYKGTTAIVQLDGASEFNNEMIGYPIQLGNFSKNAEPLAKIENPTNIISYTSSIVELLDSVTVVVETPFTTTFANRTDLLHTFTNIDSADYSISYFQTSSNIVTENERSYANLTISNIDPISGYPRKLRISIKSDGLPGDYELINEITVPFSSSLDIKIPIPSEHLEDPKRIKIQYLNSIGEISRTETITTPYNFQGGNTYIAGGKNLISGSMFISDAVGSGIEMGGVSSGFIRSVGYEGLTSASLGKAPGGFIIYSGSGNLVIGDDQLNGVGMEMVGDNDDRHFIFTTANGGLLDVKTDKFFIGTTDTQFISGSDGNIEISSSIFHLDPQNNILYIGADAVIDAELTVNSLRTPALINGAPSTKANSSSSIDADGFARFVSASIGGFEVSETQINSSNDNLILKDSGDITGSNVLFTGGKIAGFEISDSQINSTNNNIILKASGQLTASDGFLFGDKDASQYVQYSGGSLVVRGNLSVDQIFTPATIGGSPSNETNASSSITSDGFARFVSASIGGWDITTSSIEGGNLLMKPEGILQTKDFASGLAGWKISSEGNGTAEFENVRIRGTMRTTSFEKESVNAVGGQLWIANSTTLSGSIINTDTTMSVKNSKGFVDGEILIVKKVDNTGFQTEYILVNSSSVDGNQSNEDENYGRLYVTRGYGSGTSGDFVGDLASVAQSYTEGQVIVSTGRIGTGYIKLNANPSDTATPYMDIVERTGSGLYDVTLAARIGDLSGLANSDYVFGNPNPGYGLATDNVFLQGGIRANTGSIGGINMDSGKLFTGVGTWGNSNTGFYVDSESSMSLSDSFTWDGSNLAISGSTVDINVDSFFLGGNGNHISGSNGNIEIVSDNFNVTAAGDVDANNIALDGITYSSVFTSKTGVMRAQGQWPALSANENDVRWYTGSNAFYGYDYINIDLGENPFSIIRISTAESDTWQSMPIANIFVNISGSQTSRTDSTQLFSENINQNQAGLIAATYDVSGGFGGNVVTPFGNQYDGKLSWYMYTQPSSHQFTYTSASTDQPSAQMFPIEQGQRIQLGRGWFPWEILGVNNASEYSFKTIRPATSNVYDLGTSTYKWKDIYVSSSVDNTAGRRVVRINTTNGKLSYTDVDVYTLPEATSTVRGGIELFSDTDNPTAANGVTSTVGKTYGLQLNASGQGVINVPWTDTVYTLPTASATVVGGIQLEDDTVQTVAANGVTSTAGKTYGLQLNASGQGVINVPWTDTNTTYTAGSGLSLGGTTFAFDGVTATLPSRTYKPVGDAINANTDTDTIAAGYLYPMDSSGGTITITLNASTQGYEFDFFVTNLDNQIDFVADAGQTVISENGLKANAVGSAISAKYLGDNVWALVGSLNV